MNNFFTQNTVWPWILWTCIYSAPLPLYTYILGSQLLIRLTAPSKQLHSKNLCINLLTIYLVRKQYINVLHFHELKINYLVWSRFLWFFSFPWPYSQIILVWKLLSVADGGLILFSDISLDFNEPVLRPLDVH